MPRNWYYAAKTVWPLLVQAAAERRTLYYSNVAPQIGTSSISVRFALSPIQNYCMETKLPPLTSVVVSRSTSLPGEGFIAWDLDDFRSAELAVFEYPWSRVPNPFSRLGPEDNPEALAHQLVDAPDTAEEVFRKIPDRGLAQRVFRAAVGKAYGWRCSFCGTTFEESLEAAHIKPWSAAPAPLRLDVRNGLLLCATHHKLFDSRLLTIDSRYRIIYSDPKGLDGEYSEADKSLTLMIHAQELYLPESKPLWPRKDLLEKHASGDRT